MSRMWILVGMMGAGKSSVARGLAEVSGRQALDTDQLLQNRFGRSVAQIFQVYGEEAFRDHETNLLKTLEPAEAILSTGGGIVLRPENWERMRSLGIIAYLEGSPETLVSRLRHSKRRRPLLEVENWEQRLEALLESRRPLYEQADLRCTIDNKPVETIVSELHQRFKEHTP